MKINSTNNFYAFNSSETSISDTHFISRLKRHDRNAFELLYDKYASALYGAIIRLVEDEQLAQNLLQESFQEYWAQIININSNTEKLFTWMLKIAHSKCNASAHSSTLNKQIRYLSLKNRQHAQ